MLAKLHVRPIRVTLLFEIQTIPTQLQSETSSNRVDSDLEANRYPCVDIDPSVLVTCSFVDKGHELCHAFSGFAGFVDVRRFRSHYSQVAGRFSQSGWTAETEVPFNGVENFFVFYDHRTIRCSSNVHRSVAIDDGLKSVLFSIESKKDSAVLSDD